MVSALWISIQIIWMHVRPAENRFKAMLTGYLLSLPFVVAAYECINRATAIPMPELWGIGLFFAYFLHLLIFFFYVEGFYHVERSVTLRFLVEILRRSPPGARLEDILTDYNPDVMISARLKTLAENNFIECRKGRWRLKPRGRRLARIMRLTAWIYQSVSQADRL
jgi:hypothetical protein